MGSEREELDAWISYRHSLTDKLSITGTAMTWQYPNEESSKTNHYLAGGCLTYKGVADVAAGAMHIFPNGPATHGESYFVDISKTFQLMDGKLSVTPKLRVGGSREMFGTTAVRHWSPGISATLGKGPLKLTGFVTRQESLDDSAQSFTYGGVGFSYYW